MPYQQPNGKWRATKMIDGKRKQKLFPTKKEALKWETAQNVESWEKNKIPTVLWIDFATAYLKYAEDKFSHKTFMEKRLAFRRSMKDIDPQAPAETVMPAQALKLLRETALKHSGYAANKTRKNLAAACQWGVRYHGLPSANPFLAVEKFPADQSPRYVPPESDFWKVYDIADDLDRIFLLFLFHTGARVGEAFRLRWEDVDFQEGKIRLGTRKTRDHGMKYAWLPLTSDLHEALADLRKMRPFAQLVFEQKQNGGAYTSRQHMMPNLCARANVKPFGFHAIRHLAATKLAYAGLDLPTVQAMLRHGSPTTTARYIKSLGIDKSKIEQAFKQKEEARILPFASSKK